MERILAHQVRNKRQMFLVKWKGWSQENNTWEPLDNLTHCQRVLENFLADSLAGPVLDKLRVWLQIDSEEVTNAQLLKYVPKGDLRGLPSRTSVQRELLALVARPDEKRTSSILERGRRAMMLYILHERRDRQLLAMQQWQEEMNKKAVEEAALSVVNEVDLECPPAGFVYVNDYVPSEGIIIPDDPPIGCDCTACNGRTGRNCCAAQSLFAYKGHRRVNVPQGTPIYECNKRCKCDPDHCRNRVVQRGRIVPLCIFRTSDGRGWGVRTMRKIHAGEFVCEYVGEVISFEEAERRGKGYDTEGRTYLFDLDFNSHDFPYTVDAATYGNVSHFINHSCNPNLGVWAVWVNCLDPNLPKLALFATRVILKDEEITFDYMCNVDGSGADTADENIECSTTTPSRTRLKLPGVQTSLTQRPQCKCGADSCRRYLF